MSRRDRKKSLDKPPATPPLTRTPSAVAIPPPNIRKILPLSSVVKIFTTASRPNFLLPWQMGRQEQYTGSGFVINGNRILTNAHVVTDYTTVRIRRHGGQQKYQAKVLCINHLCDLALLTVEDESFWADLPALSVADEVPQLDERVLVIGYPMGGDAICVTRGVVSRVTTLSYGDARLTQLLSPKLLAVQIDAAINSGNSGGPVFRENGTVVGIAFSGYAGSADNIGYIIPYPVIKNFLATFERDGDSTEICDLGLSFELCENHSMQKALGLDQDDRTGVHVIKVKKLGPTHGMVKSGDVLMKINNFKIANDGTVSFRESERVHFAHAITCQLLGSDIAIEVLREGKVLQYTIKGMQTPQLVRSNRKYKEMPPYMILGGAVFTSLSMGLLDSAVDSFDDDSWEFSRRGKKYPDQEIIVRISWLSHPINHGYNAHQVERITKCNGTKLRNMKHFQSVVLKASRFVHLETGTKRSIYLDMEEVKKTEAEIMSIYAIPSPISADLKEVTGAYEPIPSDTSDDEGDGDDDSDDSDKDKKKKKKKQQPKKKQGVAAVNGTKGSAAPAGVKAGTKKAKGGEKKKATTPKKTPPAKTPAKTPKGKKAASNATAASSPAPKAEAPSTPSTAAPTAPTSSPASGKRKRPRRGKRTAKDQKESEAKADESQKQEQEQEQKQEQEPKTEKTPAKGKKTPQKPKKAKAAVEENATKTPAKENGSVQEAEAEAGADENTPKKAKRRTRRRRSKASASQ